MTVLFAGRYRVHARTLVVVVLALVLLVTYATRLSMPAPSGFRQELYARMGTNERSNCVEYLNAVMGTRGRESTLSLAELGAHAADPQQLLRLLARAQSNPEPASADEDKLENEPAAVDDERYAQVFSDTVAHIRVFGRALGDNSIQLEFTNERCGRLTQQLLPWYLGYLPALHGAKVHRVPCLVRQLRAKMRGSGIVVPIYPGDEAGQVARAARMLQVLRVMRNRIPVQVLYFGELLMPQRLRDRLVEAATRAPLSLPVSLHGYLGLALRHLAPRSQDLRFVNVRPALADGIQPTRALLAAMFALFSPFEEVAVMRPEAVPLMDVLVLFGNRKFRTHGAMFFHARASTDAEAEERRMETKTLIASHTPLAHEATLFGLRSVSLGAGGACIERTADPLVFLVNKRRAFAGLLMSSVLPLHNVVGWDFGDGIEHLWLGQLLAGVSGDVHFNEHPAAAAGVVAGDEREICSALWSQVCDRQVAYVTAHQLETDAKALAQHETNAALTVGKNPAFILLVFTSASWVQGATELGVWCVREADSEAVIHLTEQQAAGYLFLLDVWRQEPPHEAFSTRNLEQWGADDATDDANVS